MQIIFHITGGEEWERGKVAGGYRPRTLASEGFIHCSKPDQVVEVANRLFRGQKGLVLLCINTRRVGPEIVYENLESGRDLFPHIYGLLNLDAVVNVVSFEPEKAGRFALPAELSKYFDGGEIMGAVGG